SGDGRHPASAGSSGNGRHPASAGSSGNNCSPRRKGPNAVVHVTVDHAALVRGHTQPGETCEIPGIGPISVATARELLNDAILRVLVLDGADIKAVCSAGRWIPSSVRTALEKRDPVCVVPGCECRYRLQIDHIQEFAKSGPTKLANLARLCVTHHYLKTYKRWRLEGGPGAWRFVPPEESRPPPAGEVRPEFTSTI
ncbi:MAG: HNH endonuclease signature motif containing protein, partial [Actinomycetota bacterium]